MFPQQPTPRRTATSPDQQTRATVCCDQRGVRRSWFKQPFDEQLDQSIRCPARWSTSASSPVIGIG
jgi:hypothetical protein